MNGATVQLYMPVDLVYDALHRLEYHVDIHLLDREPVFGAPFERWTIRSILFPSHWDGLFVSLLCHQDRQGIYEIEAPDICESLELANS